MKMLFEDFKEEARVAEKRIIKEKKDIAFFYDVKKDKVVIYDYLTRKRSERVIKKNKMGEFYYNKELYFYSSCNNKEIEI